MRKLILFLAIFSLLSCKEGPNEEKNKLQSKPNSQKNKPDTGETPDIKNKPNSEQQPQEGNLEVETYTQDEKIKSKNNNELNLKIRNKSNDRIQITKLEFKNPKVSLSLSDNLESYKLNPGQENLLPLTIDHADVSGPITFDEPFIISYKEGSEDRITAGVIKVALNWISDADLTHELKLSVKPEGVNQRLSMNKILVGFTVKNEGKYTVSFDKRGMLKDDSNVENFFEIDPKKTTCKPHYDYENFFSLRPGSACELWLTVPNFSRLTNFKLAYKMLGKEAKADFAADIKSL